MLTRLSCAADMMDDAVDGAFEDEEDESSEIMNQVRAGSRVRHRSQCQCLPQEQPTGCMWLLYCLERALRTHHLA